MHNSNHTTLDLYSEIGLFEEKWNSRPKDTLSFWLMSDQIINPLLPQITENHNPEQPGKKLLRLKSMKETFVHFAGILFPYTWA